MRRPGASPRALLAQVTGPAGDRGVYKIAGDYFMHNFTGGAGNKTNTFLGGLAGNFTSTGDGNTGLGYRALTVLGTGLDNTAIGSGALIALTNGSQNVAVGADSLPALVLGELNTAVGDGSLINLTLGDRNIALGVAAGSAFTVLESSNIVIGNRGVLGDNNTMRIGTSGGGVGQVSNTYVGGINGVDVGSVASVVSINGDHLGSTAITAGGGIVVTPGPNTITISTAAAVAVQYDEDVGSAIPVAGILQIKGGTSVGGVATNINTVGAGNLVSVNLNNNINQPDSNAAGTAGYYQYNFLNFMHNYSAGAKTNAFIGSGAGNNTMLAAAISNTGIGAVALDALTTGDHNTAIGSGSLTACTTGIANTGIGGNTLEFLTVGTNNAAIGSLALNLTTGSSNTGVGSASLTNLGAGDNNTAIGRQALFNLTTGNRNIAIGLVAGQALTGAESNNIYVSNVGVLAESNTMRLGTTGVGAGQVSTTYVAGVNGVNVGNVASVVSINGDQLGSTVITAGTGVSVVPGANTITINSTGGGLTWTEILVVGPTAMAVNNGYIANNGALVTLTLPAVAAQGSVVRVVGKGAGLYTIAQGAGQSVHYAGVTTTVGVGGSLTANERYDAIELVCITADTDFAVLSSVGNFTVV